MAALLLDAGNTLVFLDTAAAAATLAADGLAVDPLALTASLGVAHRRYAERVAGGASHEEGWRLFMTQWLTAAGVASARVTGAVDALRREHDRFNLWRHLPAEVPRALSRARQAGLRLGVISNSEGQLRTLLERLALLAFFEVVVDSGVEGLRKPDPALFHLATDRLGLPPHRCLYAGDVPEVDVEGARAAGLSAVLIDALDLHPGYDDAPRFRGVGELVDALIGLRPPAKEP